MSIVTFCPDFNDENFDWLKTLRALEAEKKFKVKKIVIKSGLRPLGEVTFTKNGFKYITSFKPLEEFLKGYEGETAVGSPEDPFIGKITSKTAHYLVSDLIKEGYRVVIVK